MIRDFKPDDLDTIMNIWLTANLQTHNFINADYWQSHYEIVKNLMPEADILVSEENHQIIGFVGITGDYIAGIFVESSMQSKGIGTALMNVLKKQYKKLNLHVYKKNQRAVSFYLREGFTIQTEQLDEETGRI